MSVLPPERMGASRAIWELLRLERQAQWPWQRVQRLQQERLAALVEHARSRIPFYRDRLSGAEGLGELPTMSKDDVRDVPLAVRRGSNTNPRVVRTSGTTGEPLTVEYSHGAARLQAALRLRMVRTQGNRPWGRLAEITFLPDSRPPSTAARAYTSRRLDLDHSEPRSELEQRLGHWRPERIEGHASGLLELAPAPAVAWKPRVVANVGEQLTPELRDDLRRAFGVEPLDIYASAEAGAVAWQCRLGDLYHVNHEAVLVELLDAHGNPVGRSETGEVVVTTLWNPHMPFIRYATKDSAAWSDRPCRCGHSLPSLCQLDGRLLDFLVDAEGARVAPSRLFLSAHLPEGTPLTVVRRYQVLQKRSGVLVRIEPRDDLAQPVLEAVRRSYERVLGMPVEVAIEDTLAPEPSGRFRQFHRVADD